MASRRLLRPLMAERVSSIFGKSASAARSPQQPVERGIVYFGVVAMVNWQAGDDPHFVEMRPRQRLLQHIQLAIVERVGWLDQQDAPPAPGYHCAAVDGGVRRGGSLHPERIERAALTSRA